MRTFGKGRHQGFSTAELLVVLALGAVVLGGVMVTYGSLVAGRGRISESLQITLPGTVAANFFGPPNAARTVPIAPNYGAMAQAEKLREEFQSDVAAAAAVFCLHRRANTIINPLRRTWYPYDEKVDGALESPLDFYNFLQRFNGTATTVFEVPVNPGTGNVSPAPHASVFVVGFSADRSRLAINAIYEVDVIAFRTTKPWGFYSSVRRYTHSLVNPSAFETELSGGYEVFYQPSVRNPTNATQFSSDGFNPLFITFERAIRRSVVDDPAPGGRDRFKMAAEKPFYLLWWPDPAMPHLGDNSLNPRSPLEARRAYNHMGGRTAFMFAVPMFPAL